MSLLLFYDTETTGLPLWKEPSGHPDQPHIVELAALLVDSETRDVVGRMSAVVRPDGWVIPQETIDVHGISNAFALAEGIPEKEAINIFLNLQARADLRVGFNESFDARILRIGIKRYLDEAAAEEFKAREKACAMWESRLICNLPHAGKRNGVKLPKLGEAYEFFTGDPYQDAHRALPDVYATIAVWWGIQDRKPDPAADLAPPVEHAPALPPVYIGIDLARADDDQTTVAEVGADPFAIT